MAATLLLDVTAWDLVLDSSRNIAVATAPYSQAQDVASACRTVLGEVYYDTTLGVDYFGKIFGQNPPVPVFQAQFNAAALTVPGVLSPTTVISAYDSQARTVTGQVQFTTSAGQVTQVAI